MYRKIMKKYLIVLLLVTMVVGSLPVSVQAADNTASKMQMAKAEGSVEIAHSSGKVISLRDNMKLYNGYQVDTLEKSYAWIELDGTKLAKLDAVSEAIIRKKGKQLEILLRSGNIFFNVSEPLEDDETLNIRTSTMVTGVRGTSGWLEVMDRENVKVSILEGTVELNVSNPLTGEVKNDKVTSGETAVCTVNQPSGGASGESSQCGIQRESYKREEIGGFVLQEVFADTTLAEKIVEKGGLDLRDLTKEEVDTRLKADEEVIHEKMVEVEMAMEAQVANVSAESVWVKTEEPAPQEPEAVAENVPNTNVPAVPTPKRQPEPVVEPPVVEQPIVVLPVPEPVKPQPAPEPAPTPPTQPQPETPSAAVPEASVSYNDATQTLTVSAGRMNDYRQGSGNTQPPPWDGYKSQIKNIVLESGVTYIGVGTFSNFTEITSVKIPSTVEVIGSGAFSGCTNLESVTIEGNGLKEIWENVFFGCGKLNSIAIPSSVTNIGKNAFFQCTGLKEITIPNGVKKIGELTFGSSNLETLKIPVSVDEIGVAAFGGCNLREVHFDGSSDAWINLTTGKDVFRGNRYPNVNTAEQPRVVCTDGEILPNGIVSSNNPLG